MSSMRQALVKATLYAKKDTKFTVILVRTALQRTQNQGGKRANPKATETR